MTEMIDFWSVQSRLYPLIDARYMRGEVSLKNAQFDLGAGQVFEMSLSSKNGSPIAIHQPFSTRDIDCKMYFRSGTENWLGVDNQANHAQLHMHLVSGAQTWKDILPLSEQTTVAQLVSDVFDKAEEIVRWKFKGSMIGAGSDFTGPS